MDNILKLFMLKFTRKSNVLRKFHYLLFLFFPSWIVGASSKPYTLGPNCLDACDFVLGMFDDEFVETLKDWELKSDLWWKLELENERKMKRGKDFND